MALSLRNQIISPLGNIHSPSPKAVHWGLAGLGALTAHALAAWPFLPPIIEQDPVEVEAVVEETEIGVTLAPVVRPPEPPPEIQPEPEENVRVIEERASTSPPPAPPAKPRSVPDIPDIQPQAVPDLWSGAPGSRTVTLDEYLQLREWLAEARRTILQDLSYPLKARQLGLSGSAMVDIVASAEGRILSWTFRRRTGEIILDKEISDTIDGIRRLPKFPKGTTYASLSFTVPIRFELVFEDRRGREIEPPPTDGSAAPAQAPAETRGLSVSAIAQCASLAAELTAERSAVEAKRDALETLRTEYEQDLIRYERDNQRPPLRVRRKLDQYNEGVTEYEALIAGFQANAASFASRCGKGSATWENYQRACRPYISTGNAYCEAFGDLWDRLRATG